MSSTNSIATGLKFARAVAGTLLAAVILAGCGGGGASGSSSGPPSHASSAGKPPPEWAGSSWPTHNHDLANTRATTSTPINSQTVSGLKVKWRFAFKGLGASGAFASTPIVLNNTVYLQDLASNVYALNRSDGKLLWEHRFNEPNVGPNGVSYGYGRLFGATETKAFALDPATGKVLWSRKLTRNSNEGIDMAPQLYDNTVLVSTVPGNTSSFYKGNGVGVVWALDAATGKAKWRFSTVSDGAKLWGHPVGQQRRRHLVSTGRRRPGARLPLGGQPGTAVRDAEVPERVEPPGSGSLHGFARRSQRSDRQAALVSPGDRA